MTTFIAQIQPKIITTHVNKVIKILVSMFISENVDISYLIYYNKVIIWKMWCMYVSFEQCKLLELLSHPAILKTKQVCLFFWRQHRGLGGPVVRPLPTYANGPGFDSPILQHVRWLISQAFTYGRVGLLIVSWSWTWQSVFISFRCLWIQLCKNLGQKVMCI